MQPISQNNPNLYKGPSSSTEFNKLRNDIHYDLVTLFDLANKHEEEIKTNMDVLIRENFFLQSRIIELEKLVEKISQDLVYKNEGVSKQRLIKSFYDLSGLSDGAVDKPAYVNTIYGYLSIPPFDSVSKINYQGDDGQVVIPKSLSVQLLESHNAQPKDPTTGNRTYYSVEDENILRAFDHNRNTFWVHTSSFPSDSGVSEVFGILHIKLPLDALNDVYSNTLVLNPFPEYSMTIHDIQYKGVGDQWYRLENYPTEKVDGQDVPVAIERAGKMTFAFSKTEITEIQIFFSQPYWFENDGRREFAYGFQEIDLEHRIFSNKTAEIVTEFSLEGTTKAFRIIENPTVIPASGTFSNINDLVEHKLYYNKDLTNEFKFGNEILAPIQKVYVKTILRGSEERIPMIKQIQLDFTYRDLNT